LPLSVRGHAGHIGGLRGKGGTWVIRWGRYVDTHRRGRAGSGGSGGFLVLRGEVRGLMGEGEHWLGGGVGCGLGGVGEGRLGRALCAELRLRRRA
jgi:hypothetical protein